MKYCSNCGTLLENENQQVCTKCGAVLGTETKTVEYPMKWYKFLIYFALFLGAIINLVNGINFITGNIYVSQGVTAAQVYSVFGSNLKIMDMIYGVASIGLAVFGIYTRFRLANYKTNAPMCVYILYGASTLIGLLYGLVVTVLLGENAINFASLAGSAVALICNYIYFTKRKSLFINE